MEVLTMAPGQQHEGYKLLQRQSSRRSRGCPSSSTSRPALELAVTPANPHPPANRPTCLLPTHLLQATRCSAWAAAGYLRAPLPRCGPA